MKIGFIGVGNMAKAMIGGILKGNLVPPSDIIGSTSRESSLTDVVKQFGINGTTDNREVARAADVLVLSVKPQMYESVIENIKDDINPKSLVVTIAPGFTLERLSGLLGVDKKIIRTMPNTPAMVGEGVTAICPNENVSKEELDFVIKLFESFGIASVIKESMMNGVISVSGSSPAYVYMFIEAMADGAVALGLPRNMAYEMAAQAVLGSAKMVLETGKHPGELKDMVCSPGGTTIEAVRSLEDSGFRSSIVEAMMACAEKASKM